MDQRIKDDEMLSEVQLVLRDGYHDALSRKVAEYRNRTTLATVRFDSLPVGARFMHIQFGAMVFTKNSSSSATATESDGVESVFHPNPGQPVNPVAMNVLDLCMTLRRAGYRPHALMKVAGRELELISYPFPTDTAAKTESVSTLPHRAHQEHFGKVACMAREPGDPTTMFEWVIPDHVIIAAIESFG